MNAFEISMLVQLVIVVVLGIYVIILDRNNIKNKIKTRKSIRQYERYISNCVSKVDNVLDRFFRFNKYMLKLSKKIGCAEKVEDIIRNDILKIRENYVKIISERDEFLNKSYKAKLEYLRIKDNYYGLADLLKTNADSICDIIKSCSNDLTKAYTDFQLNRCM